MEQLIFLVNKHGQPAKVCIARMQDATVEDAVAHGKRNIEQWKRHYPAAHTFYVESVADDMAVAPPKV